MTEQARIVVIGGGVVGASCLYHLALRGWHDAILLERDELTAGSTWHAAGNVPTFATSALLLRLQSYSAQLYRGLAAATGTAITYHVTGSLRLAHTRERMDEFAHIAAMANAQDMGYEVLPPERIAERHSFATLDGLRGALWDPCDGDIDPSQLTQAFAKGARDRGARIRRGVPVTGLSRRPNGEWLVRTPAGDVVAEIVVNAGGYRAGEVMAMLGRTLPSVAMSHQYLVTEGVPELAARSGRLPLLRDPDVSYYLRQERNGFLLGPYERQAMPMWVDGVPEHFAFQLWDDDLARLEPIIAAAMERVPLLRTAGVRRVINGPIPYSPDGHPFIGPEHGLKNFFHCNSFSFGIAQAGGAGKCLAEWVIDGRPEWDLWALDRRRFTGFADWRFAVARAVDTYQHEYAPAFPFGTRHAGRPLRRSPLHARLLEKGASFGTEGGWERPLHFAGSADADMPSFRRTRHWRPAAAAEVGAVRQRIGICDLTGITMLELQGPGAAAGLERALCTPLPLTGEVADGLALTADGRLLSQFEVVRTAADAFLLLSAAAASWHDADVLGRGLPSDAALREVTGLFGVLLVAGPQADTLLHRVTGAAPAPRSARTITLAGEPVLVAATRRAGESGWLLFPPLAALPILYEHLCREGAAFGIADIGARALETLRIEACRPAWKAEITTDLAVADIGPVPLILDDAGDADALPSTPVLHDGRPVGTVTSACWSPTLQRSVALAMLRAEFTGPGTRLVLDLLGERRRASVAAPPLVTPSS